MTTITVDLTQLYTLIRRMRRDDMTYVSLSIDPPDDAGGISLPACLSVSGIRSAEPDVAVEYDPIDAVPIDPPSGVVSRAAL